MGNEQVPFFQCWLLHLRQSPCGRKVLADQRPERKARAQLDRTVVEPVHVDTAPAATQFMMLQVNKRVNATSRGPAFGTPQGRSSDACGDGARTQSSQPAPRTQACFCRHRSSRSGEILPATHVGAAWRDAAERVPGPQGYATLLPIPQRVNADAQRFGKLSLCQTGESAQGDDVCHGVNPAAHDAFALVPRHAARKIFFGQLANVIKPSAPPSLRYGNDREDDMG